MTEENTQIKQILSNMDNAAAKRLALLMKVIRRFGKDATPQAHQLLSELPDLDSTDFNEVEFWRKLSFRVKK